MPATTPVPPPTDVPTTCAKRGAACGPRKECCSSLSCTFGKCVASDTTEEEACACDRLSLPTCPYSTTPRCVDASVGDTPAVRWLCCRGGPFDMCPADLCPGSAPALAPAVPSPATEPVPDLGANSPYIPHPDPVGPSPEDTPPMPDGCKIRPCHLGCNSVGTCQWLGGRAEPGDAGCAACLSPTPDRDIERTSPGGPSLGSIPDIGDMGMQAGTSGIGISGTAGEAGGRRPFGLGDIPDIGGTENAAAWDAEEASDDSTSEEEYCPYANGCHEECIGGRYRLRAGEGEDPEGVSAGDPCVSPASQARPSIFSNVVSGIQRLFYRPQAE
ncbi:MAG: hypothetical protein Greene041662_641 [Candidatus Peregrinibacteria bacterium Greene0416_62]|nr:MAG: hypothetical protein Greene041662_641 [Candidatus Peregrinibacteria bacterium Greene0416_62]